MSHTSHACIQYSKSTQMLHTEHGRYKHNRALVGTEPCLVRAKKRFLASGCCCISFFGCRKGPDQWQPEAACLHPCLRLSSPLQSTQTLRVAAAPSRVHMMGYSCRHSPLEYCCTCGQSLPQPVRPCLAGHLRVAREPPQQAVPNTPASAPGWYC
jgi:hypothetical protein